MPSFIGLVPRLPSHACADREHRAWHVADTQHTVGRVANGWLGEASGKEGVAGVLKVFLSRARWAVLDIKLGTAGWHG